MLKNIGITEIVIVAVILLVLFGGRKLPEFGRGLGQTLKELKNAMSGKEDSKDSDK